MIADLRAITPLYGDLAERFCLIEAGGMAQLLASHGDGVGVCPVGFVDFASAAEALGLGPDHRLVYTLLGGAPATEGRRGGGGRPRLGGRPGAANAPGSADAPAPTAAAAPAAARTGAGPPRRVPVALPTDELHGDTRLRLPAVTPRDRAEPIRSVLLTGGTGYLGRQLVVELLARTDVTVHALATAADADAARDRVLAAVREAGLALPPGTAAAAGRRRRRPGPAPARAVRGRHERLAEEVGAVYHSAAKVRWLRPYEDLKEVNVTGTRRVLDLVADGAPKRLVHVSTLAVFPFGGSEPVPEDGPLDHGGLLYGGYPQSKWVAEKLVAAAAAQGLDTWCCGPARSPGPAAPACSTRSPSWSCCWPPWSGSAGRRCRPPARTCRSTWSRSTTRRGRGRAHPVPDRAGPRRRGVPPDQPACRSRCPSCTTRSAGSATRCGRSRSRPGGTGCSTRR